MHKKITIQRSSSELIVIVDDGSQIREHSLAGADSDGVRLALLREGCVERQIVAALELLEAYNTATIIADTER